jgi:hypothetical protein
VNQYEQYSKILQDFYKKDKPDHQFISCVVDTESQWNFLFFTDEKRKNKKTGFCITDVEPISSIIPTFAMQVQLNSRKLKYGERTGVFKIKFNDGSFMYVAKWFSGFGKHKAVESMFATEGETWVKFLSMSKKITQRNIKPKIGVYNLYLTAVGVMYDKFTKIPNNVIFHDQLPLIKKNVDYYFNNVATFMKYNQAGRRTILLYGEPGTSKTSTLYQLAAAHKDTKSVVFTSNIRALIHHIAMCEKYSVPTIACFEDCESVFQQNNSEVKGLLSGIHAKQNKAGACMIFTTNYPDRIEQSILQRPERIDELHYIGSISGKLLVDCAKYYFGTFAPSEEQLARVLTKPMAGAEVKLFVDNTLRYCAANQKEIDEDSMRTVLGNYRKDIKDLQKFIKGRASKTLAQTYDDKDDEAMGFRPKQIDREPIEINWSAK